jgi:hypothetical protein
VTQTAAKPSPFRHWSAIVPIGMSVAALLFILIFVAVVGIQPPQPHQDEGAPARIFQLTMLAQLPIIAYFALTWLPRNVPQALRVLVLQGIAWLVPVATIFFLETR